MAAIGDTFFEEPAPELARTARIACDLFRCDAAFVLFVGTERSIVRGWHGVDAPPEVSVQECEGLPAAIDVVSNIGDGGVRIRGTRLVRHLYARAQSFGIARLALSADGPAGYLIVVSSQAGHLSAADHTRLDEYAQLVSYGIQTRAGEREAESARQQLAESEGRTRALLKALPDLIFRLSREGVYLDVHAPEEDLLVAKSLRGRTLAEVMPAELAAKLLACIRESLDTRSLQSVEYELSTAGRGRRLFEARISPYNEDEVVFTVRDVTSQRESAAQIEARDKVLLAVTQATTILLTRPGFSKAVHEAFSIIGRAVDVDRVYLFENHVAPDGDLLCSQRFEWVRDQVSTEIDNPILQNMSYTAHFPEWREVMERGEPVARLVKNLEPGLRDVMQDQSIKALLLVPIIQNGDFIGFVGLDDCRQERLWDEMELSVLSTAAACLGGAILQRKARFEIGSSRARYKALVDNISDVIFQTDTEGVLTFVNRAWERIVGLTSEEALGHRLSEFVVDGDSVMMRQCLRLLLAEEVAECRHDVRMVASDGEVRWVQLYARVSSAESGEVSGVFGTLHDITERREYEDALVAAKERAEEMASLKSSFLANMSHEIRTPLTSILGFSQILLEEMVGEEREMLDLIVRNGHRLMETLNSVLELARLESDGIRLNMRMVRVDDEVSELVQLFGSDLSHTHVDLRTEINGAATAYTDQAILRRILTNLIGNALKFTEQGEVVVTVREEPDAVRVSVRDTGVGIDSEFLDNLFDDFTQESSGLDRRFEGSGLGLSITRRLLALIGANILVESEKGAGSTFTIELVRRPSLHSAAIEQEFP
jgi:PAS domain S-box-containing protein